MKRGCIVVLLLLMQSALAAPVPLTHLLEWSHLDTGIDTAVAAYGFQPYGEVNDTSDGALTERHYGDDAKPPRNISWWMDVDAHQTDVARLGYDVYDAAEIQALQTDLLQAGFTLLEQGEVSRAYYALYRNEQGREVQINTPKRSGGAVGFVFYRQSAL